MMPCRPLKMTKKYLPQRENPLYGRPLVLKKKIAYLPNDAFGSAGMLHTSSTIVFIQTPLRRRIVPMMTLMPSIRRQLK